MTTATRILSLLQGRQMTTSQMAEALDLSPNTVRITAARMRDSLPKRIRIAAWTPSRQPGGPYAIYALGDQPDTPKPRRISKKEANRRAWRRIKADPVKHTDALMKQRIRHAKHSPPPPADPLMAWMPRRAV